MTQGTKVKRQIPFLDVFPVQIRKLGVTVQAQVRPHPRWCSVVPVAGVRRLSLHQGQRGISTTQGKENVSLREGKKSLLR